MIEYRCGKCKRGYSSSQYRELDRQPLNPDDDDPMKGSGYEAVCECGAGFHSDKWSLRETIDTKHGEIIVSTVALTIGHGPNHNHWYETCLFHTGGSRVVDRYTVQPDAEEGHSDYVTAVEEGYFTMKPTGQQIELDR